MKDRIRRDRGSGGFTLIELLITIVIVGILAAVVVLAIGGLTGSGNRSACGATKDAAVTAAVAYYSDHSTAVPTPDPTPWPQSFTEMTTAPAYLQLRDGTAQTATTLTHSGGWTLTMTGLTGTAEPTFTCS